MKKEKTVKKSISKIAIERCQKTRKGLSWHLCFFALVSILCFCLGYINQVTLFLTIPFLVIPSLFSFIAINAYDNKKELEGVTPFATFRMYFSRVFFGGFRVITGFFKAILSFIISSIVLSIVAGFAILPNIPEYNELVNSLPDNISTADIFEEYSKFATSNETFSKVISILLVIALFCAAITFIHHIFHNSIKYYYNFTTRMPLVAAQLNITHKEVMFKHKKEILKDYFSATWFLHIILLISFAGGFAINYFALNSFDIGEIFVLGLALALVLILPFMNYLSYALMAIHLKYKTAYVDETLATSLKLMEKFKNNKVLSEEDKKEFDKFINDFKKEAEKEKNRDKEDK